MNQRNPGDNDPAGSFPAPNRPNSNPMANYQFSPEEKKVLQECNTESFFQRCIPIGTSMGLAAYYGVRSGYFKPNARWGAFPKVALAVTVGYFMGKFSYQQKCAEKFMKLPNSQIGEMLRQKRRGNIKESLDPGFGPSMSLAPFSSGITSTDTYSDVSPRNSLDIDTERPRQQGLDDYRPNMESQIYEEEMPPQQKHSTSYEELRKQNREDYQSRRTGGPFRNVPEVSEVVPPMVKRGPRTQENYSDNKSSRTNQYGDTME